MDVKATIAEILKREGTEILCCYPQNPIVEAAAQADIRTVVVRQERTGAHMADAMSRISSGEKLGVFAMQRGPGTENVFGGVAQAFAESVPMVVLPSGNNRAESQVLPNFNTARNFAPITKWSEQLLVPEATVHAMRRMFTQARNGRPGPTLLETPVELMNAEVPGPLVYEPTRRHRVAPDPQDVAAAAAALVDAKRPVIYAGQGIHYAKAWPQLVAFAELLEAPVCTSLAGKSAFPENHALALGAGGPTFSKQLYHCMTNADVILGIGCSFSSTPFGITMPPGKKIIHATLDPWDLNKAHATDLAVIGDAALILEALLEEVKDRLGGKPRGQLAQVTGEIKQIKDEWLAEWKPHLMSEKAPISPYRVIWDLMKTVDTANTIITHDSGSPRNQITPFWESPAPLGYIGWGKSTQLGYGLGLAMGAKLAAPEKTCINFWGDAAIGFTGMDLETAAREQIPILSINVNNSTMAAEHTSMPTATEKYRSTDISGNYSEMAKAFGLYSERIEDPKEIVPAIERGLAKTKDGTPVLLEFITEYSSPATLPGFDLSPHRKARVESEKAK